MKIQIIQLPRLSLAILCGLSALSCPAATTNLWSGGGGADTLWSNAANWSPSVPTATDAAVFNDTAIVTDSVTANNSIAVDTTVAALSYTNTTGWHVTQIPANNTLSVSSATIIGGLPVASITTSVAMIGEGTFSATGNMTLGNGNVSSGSQAPGNLDLSGLAVFNYNASSGTIGIGTTGSRSSGNLTLAYSSNNITAGTINIAGATGTSSTLSLNLGAGTNILNVGTFNVGSGRATTTLKFLAETGGLRLRGTAGTDSSRTTMTVGNRNQGGTSTLTTTGTADLNAHPVDLMLSTLTVGTVTRNGTEANFRGVGIFQFDQGIVDATTVTMGVDSGTSPSSGGIGTVTVGSSATLLAGSISLANVSSGVATCFGNGTLNIQGGTVICAGDLGKTTTLNSTGAVNMVSGSLTVRGSIGTAANPINSLDLTGANLTVRAGAAAPVNVTALNASGANTLNILSFPSITSYPAQYQVIKYADAIGGTGFDAFQLGALPEGTPPFQAYLSNNVANLSIDIVVTGGPNLAQPVVWTGAQNGNWDTTTLNWIFGTTPTNYNNAGDLVTFDESTAVASTVNLVTPVLTPGSITVLNTTKPFVFSGTGKLSGSTGISKQGGGTLTIANDAVNDFSGSISVEGTLVYAQAANVNLANVISGAGTFAQSGSGTLTLNAVNTGLTGGVAVNSGVLKSGNINAFGTGTATVNPGGTLILGANHTNSVVLAGGTFGSSVSLSPTALRITAAPSTTSTLYMADPQNLVAPTDGLEMNFTNSWRGSGTVIVATVLNDPSPDGGNGFRLRGVDTTDFSGTLVLSNKVKGEIQTSVAGPFSPLGTGKIVVTAGVLTNDTVQGTYAEFNIRNNYTGATVFGNDVEISGTGIAVLDPLGSAPDQSSITMGNLKIGGGQELGVNLNGALTAATHPVIFTSATLTGGNATFSPKTPGWNTTPQVGADLTLNNVGETAPSGIIMRGLRTLTLTGTSTYTGNTLVESGTLKVDGALNGGGEVVVNAAIITGAGSIKGNLIVNAAGTLKPGAGLGILSVGGNATLHGTNEMEIDRTAASNDRLNVTGTVTYGGTLSLVNLGADYVAGDSFKLFNAASYTGDFAEIIPAIPGPGLTWNLDALKTTGTIGVRGPSAPPEFTGVTYSSGSIGITGTNGTAGAEYRIITSADLTTPVVDWTAATTNNFDANGAFSISIPVSTAEPQRFFRILLP